MKVLSFIGLVVAAITAMYYFLDSHLEKFYVFQTDQLHSLALSAIEKHGNDTVNVVKYIVEDLNAKMPQYVNLDEEWMFNNAGGAMGAMYIIHASITEYLIIFGTAVGTEGHSGRHTADDYFYILKGAELTYTPGLYEPDVFPQGTVNHMRRGEVRQYKMESACFALEYARGWIPPMLFFGFADGFSSTLDVPTMWRTSWITAKLMGTNLLKGKF